MEILLEFLIDKQMSTYYTMDWTYQRLNPAVDSYIGLRLWDFYSGSEMAKFRTNKKIVVMELCKAIYSYHCDREIHEIECLLRKSIRILSKFEEI